MTKKELIKEVEKTIRNKIKDKSNLIFSEIFDILADAEIEEPAKKLSLLCELEYALTMIEEGHEAEDFSHLTN